MTDGTDSRYHFEVGPEHVGARLLDIVSGALYGNVLDILREYIQNAVDAGAGQIRLVLRDNEIWIRDDGAGLTPIALDNARKVAVSGKRADDVGFRGIGVYSSYMSCDGLELITRPTGEQTVHVLRLDFKGMREEVEKRSAADPPESLSLQEALSTFTEIGPYERNAPLDDGKPFALVRLRNPDAHLVDALEDTPALTKYLRSAVPLNFPPGHQHAERVLEGLRQHGLERRAINIDLTPRGKDPSKEGVAHPFYLSEFNRLLRPVVVEVHGGGRKVAVLWYSVHQERFVLPEGESGLQVRLKGFGIGDISLPEKLWGAAGSGILYRHLVGEVHVVDPRLRPSAERSNFEDSPARRELMSSLQKRFGTVGRWIQRRQTVLGGIERGQTITPEQQAELDRLSKSYGSVPPLAGVEILDTPAKRVHDAPKPTGTGSEDEESGSGGPEDGGGGSGQDSGGAGGEDGAGEQGETGGGEGTGSGEGGDGSGGGGGQGGGGDGGGTTTDTSPPKPPAPTIAKMLFDIPLRWPNGARQVFGTLDEAVREELPADTANVVRGGIRDRLGKLTFPNRRRRRSGK